MTMYQELHRWEDAIAVAEARVSRVHYDHDIIIPSSS